MYDFRYKLGVTFCFAGVHCGWPANGTNTNMTITGTQYQDKVFYHCFPGYEYYNIYNTLYYETFPRHCLHTAVWQPPIDCQSKTIKNICNRIYPTTIHCINRIKVTQTNKQAYKQTNKQQQKQPASIIQPRFQLTLYCLKSRIIEFNYFQVVPKKKSIICVVNCIAKIVPTMLLFYDSN